MKVAKFLTVISAVLIFNTAIADKVFAQETGSTNRIEKPKAETPYMSESKDSNGELVAKKQTNEKYRIGFQDTLEIQVFRHPELSQVVNVSPDGTIYMPKIDKPIIAVCKTERELSETVGTLYKSYLKNPFVNVRAVEQRSQPFAVIGAVEKPGSFYLNRKIRLLELLAFAGGPKVEKAGANIQVARVGNVSGCAETTDSETDEIEFLTYKIKDVQEGKENPWMQPGDIVSVLEVEQAYVVGNVKEPTKVPLREPVTLTQAIAAAGGLSSEAKTSKVRIQRQGASSSAKSELVYDLKDIVSKKIPDPVLQANDIVEVPKDGIKSIRNGIIKALSSGIGGLFYGL
jgi:polysaccharide export outer membrane protein